MQKKHLFLILFALIICIPIARYIDTAPEREKERQEKEKAEQMRAAEEAKQKREREATAAKNHRNQMNNISFLRNPLLTEEYIRKLVILGDLVIPTEQLGSYEFDIIDELREKVKTAKRFYENKIYIINLLRDTSLTEEYVQKLVLEGGLVIPKEAFGSYDREKVSKLRKDVEEAQERLKSN